MRCGNYRLRILAVFVAVAVLIPSCSSGGNGGGSDDKDRTITIGQGEGYADDVAVNALWKHLLEKKGWHVKTKSMELGPIFTGVSSGEIDGYLDTWLPNTHKSYVKKYKDDLKVLDAWNKEAELGLAVPDYLDDVQTLDDLRDHANKFDDKIVGIEPGSGQMKLLKDEVLPAYGLDKEFHLVGSSSSAMLVSLKKALANKDPVVVALWKPHWAWSRYQHIRFLKDPKDAWPPPDSVHMVLNKKFVKDHSEVTGWFQNTKLNAEQWNDLMLAVQKSKNSEQGVRSWLKKSANRKLVEDWTDS